MKGLLACGDLFFSRIKADGSYEGFMPVGVASKLGIKASSSIEEQLSRGCADYGQVVDSVAIPTPTEVSIELGHLNKQNLAIQFMGTYADQTVTAGAVTDVATGMDDVDGIVVLPHNKISNVVVKDATLATTYTEGTDYEVVNAVAGLIKPLTGGAIASGDTVAISYDYASSTSTVVFGGTQSQVKVGVMLVGKNLVDGNGLTINIWRTTLAPNGEIDFLSDKLVKISLNGKAEVVDGKPSTFQAEVDKL